MAAKIPIQRYGETLSKYARRLRSAYLKPYRDLIRLMRNETEHEILKTQLGKHLWGGSSNIENPGPGKPRFLMGKPRLRFSNTQTVFLGGFKVNGMAALILKGGRTERHLIRPVRAERLRFEVGGADVFAKAVGHPGGPVERVPVLERIVDRRAAQFPGLASRAMDKAAQESFK